jgi:hypothetical protein
MILGEIVGRSGSDEGGFAGGIVVVREGGRIVAAFGTALGRLPAGDGDAPLGDLAREHGARWALRIDRGTLAMLSDRFAQRLAPSDDLLRQALKLAATIRELAQEGLLETFPRDARQLPVPSELVVRRGLDAVCPVGKSLLFAAFEGDRVATSIALHRAADGFDRVVGPARARHELGLVTGDWLHDCRGLSRAVELSVGPLALGCFAQTATWRTLLRDTSPGAWASAVAQRELVFHPVAPAIVIPLGVDVGRVALLAARELAARLGASPWVGRGSPLWAHGPLALVREFLRG